MADNVNLKAAAAGAATAGSPGVFILDADPPARQQLSGATARTPWAPRAFGTLEQLVAHVSQPQPGCIVLGLGPRSAQSVDAIAQLRQRGYHQPVIVTAVEPNLPLAVQAMRAGAHNVLDKHRAADDLPPAIHEAMNHLQQQRRSHVVQMRLGERFARLTAAEIEVLELLLQGKSNRAMADDLAVSLRTIEVRRGKVMRKMQAGSLAQLVQMAVQLRRDHD